MDILKNIGIPIGLNIIRHDYKKMIGGNSSRSSMHKSSIKTKMNNIDNNLKIIYNGPKLIPDTFN